MKKFVYLLKEFNSKNSYKIGVSKNKPNRISQLQTGNKNKIELVDFYETDFYSLVETTLHNMYSHKKVNPEDFTDVLKGEWFYLDEKDVIDFVDKCKKIEKNIKFLKDNKSFFL